MAPGALAGGNIVIIKKSGEDGSKYPLPAGSIAIGRGSECDLKILLKDVSVVQCTVTVYKNFATITNISDEFPTIINNESVDSKVLKHGDVITLSNKNFRWEYTQPNAVKSKIPVKAVGLKKKLPSFPASVVAKKKAANAAGRQSDIFPKKVDAQIRKLVESRGRLSLGDLPNNIAKLKGGQSMTMVSTSLIGASPEPKIRKIAVVKPQRRSAELITAIETGAGGDVIAAQVSSDRRSSVTKPRLVIRPHRGKSLSPPKVIPGRMKAAGQKRNSLPGESIKGKRKGAGTPSASRGTPKRAASMRKQPMIVGTAQLKRIENVEKVVEPATIDEHKKAALMLLTGRSPIKKQTTPSAKDKQAAFAFKSVQKQTPRSQAKAAARQPSGAKPAQSVAKPVIDTPRPKTVPLPQNSVKRGPQTTSAVKRTPIVRKTPAVVKDALAPRSSAKRVATPSLKVGVRKSPKRGLFQTPTANWPSTSKVKRTPAAVGNISTRSSQAGRMISKTPNVGILKTPAHSAINVTASSSTTKVLKSAFKSPQSKSRSDRIKFNLSNLESESQSDKGNVSEASITAAASPVPKTPRGRKSAHSTPHPNTGQKVLYNRKRGADLSMPLFNLSDSEYELESLSDIEPIEMVPSSRKSKSSADRSSNSSLYSTAVSGKISQSGKSPTVLSPGDLRIASSVQKLSAPSKRLSESQTDNKPAKSQRNSRSLTGNLSASRDSPKPSRVKSGRVSKTPKLAKVIDLSQSTLDESGSNTLLSPPTSVQRINRRKSTKKPHKKSTKLSLSDVFGSTLDKTPLKSVAKKPLRSRSLGNISITDTKSTSRRSRSLSSSNKKSLVTPLKTGKNPSTTPKLQTSLNATPLLSSGKNRSKIVSTSNESVTSLKSGKSSPKTPKSRPPGAATPPKSGRRASKTPRSQSFLNTSTESVLTTLRPEEKNSPKTPKFRSANQSIVTPLKSHGKRTSKTPLNINSARTPKTPRRSAVGISPIGKKMLRSPKSSSMVNLSTGSVSVEEKSTPKNRRSKLLTNVSSELNKSPISPSKSTSKRASNSPRLKSAADISIDSISSALESLGSPLPASKRIISKSSSSMSRGTSNILSPVRSNKSNGGKSPKLTLTILHSRSSRNVNSSTVDDSADSIFSTQNDDTLTRSGRNRSSLNVTSDSIPNEGIRKSAGRTPHSVKSSGSISHKSSPASQASPDASRLSLAEDDQIATPSISVLFEPKSSTPKPNKRTSARDSIKHFEFLTTPGRRPPLQRSQRKTVGAIGNRISARKSEIERTMSPSSERKPSKGVRKAALKRARGSLNLDRIKSSAKLSTRSNRSSDLSSNNSNTTDVNAPRPDNSIIVTPKSTLKLVPELVKEKHSTAKKNRVSRKSFIDHIYDSQDIVKQLFAIPVKRKLSQSIGRFDASDVNGDDFNSSVASLDRSSRKSKTPNVSFEFDGVRTPAISADVFVSSIDTSGPSKSSRSSLAKRTNSTQSPKNVSGISGLLKTPVAKRPSRNSSERGSGKKLNLSNQSSKTPTELQSSEEIDNQAEEIRYSFPPTVTEVNEDLTNVGERELSPMGNDNVRYMFASSLSSGEEQTHNISDAKPTANSPKSAIRYQKSPKNDLSNVSGVRKLLRTPPRSPRNDLSDLRGVRRLLASPNVPQRFPRNDLSNVRGVKRLLKTPSALPKSPLNDLSDIRGVRKLLKTPGGPPKSPKNDLSNVRGVKRLLKTPGKSPKSPPNDLSDVRGVKRLLKTPGRPPKSPRNDLGDVRGVKQLFNPIAASKSPRNSLTNVDGVGDLFKSPNKKQKSPKNDLSDLQGVGNLLKTPGRDKSGNLFDSLLGKAPLRTYGRKSPNASKTMSSSDLSPTKETVDNSSYRNNSTLPVGTKRKSVDANLTSSKKRKMVASPNKLSSPKRQKSRGELGNLFIDMHVDLNVSGRSRLNVSGAAGKSKTPLKAKIQRSALLADSIGENDRSLPFKKRILARTNNILGHSTPLKNEISIDRNRLENTTNLSPIGHESIAKETLLLVENKRKRGRAPKVVQKPQQTAADAGSPRTSRSTRTGGVAKPIGKRKRGEELESLPSTSPPARKVRGKITDTNVSPKSTNRGKLKNIKELSVSPKKVTFAKEITLTEVTKEVANETRGRKKPLRQNTKESKEPISSTRRTRSGPVHTDSPKNSPKIRVKDVSEAGSRSRRKAKAASPVLVVKRTGGRKVATPSPKRPAEKAALAVQKSPVAKRRGRKAAAVASTAPAVPPAERGKRGATAVALSPKAVSPKSPSPKPVSKRTLRGGITKGTQLVKAAKSVAGKPSSRGRTRTAVSSTTTSPKSKPKKGNVSIVAPVEEPPSKSPIISSSKSRTRGKSKKSSSPVKVESPKASRSRSKAAAPAPKIVLPVKARGKSKSLLPSKEIPPKSQGAKKAPSLAKIDSPKASRSRSKAAVAPKPTSPVKLRGKSKSTAPDRSPAKKAKIVPEIIEKKATKKQVTPKKGKGVKKTAKEPAKKSPQAAKATRSLRQRK